MTASDVIDEIKQLPRTEQTRVLQFALELARERQLSGKDLAGLAQRMIDSTNPEEAEGLKTQNLPPQLLRHLLDRIEQRNISVVHLAILADWLKTEPEVPSGKWFKELGDVTVCGEGELIKTFLQSARFPLDKS